MPWVSERREGTGKGHGNPFRKRASLDSKDQDDTIEYLKAQAAAAADGRMISRLRETNLRVSA
jgi:hypothetical protein